MILENKKAVIFDMDGTLIDSMWVWQAIDIEFLSKRGYTVPSDMEADIEGKSFHETAAYFKKRFSLEEDIETIMHIWNDMAYDKYTHDIKLKPNTAEFLEYLHSRGILLGIATSNSKKLVNGCLSAIGIDKMFDAVVTADDIHAGKPNPDIYLKAAALLNVSPQECLVFEDVPMGILAGKNAGMTVCAVDDVFSEKLNEKKKLMADYFINDYAELLK